MNYAILGSRRKATRPPVPTAFLPMESAPRDGTKITLHLVRETATGSSDICTEGYYWPVQANEYGHHWYLTEYTHGGFAEDDLKGWAP
ncbi:hypothetical protein P6U16_05845 [Rhizobium sp. 32-5/1]|uniref:hypothetical protein n=1 Tax=Rhizobium sp. 32-5/1 TaxID=3019602 RepID=UPI00240E7C19|nr:hypothetical protein [Rhizobium sp. 32-5/1]WEZ84202.1 hypothetical protein P6U16_05845 [Rhizobium sp. 32-5/1]